MDNNKKKKVLNKTKENGNVSKLNEEIIINTKENIEISNLYTEELILSNDNNKVSIETIVLPKTKKNIEELSIHELREYKRTGFLPNL